MTADRDVEAAAESVDRLAELLGWTAGELVRRSSVLSVDDDGESWLVVDLESVARTATGWFRRLGDTGRLCRLGASSRPADIAGGE